MVFRVVVQLVVQTIVLVTVGRALASASLHACTSAYTGVHTDGLHPSLLGGEMGAFEKRHCAAATSFGQPACSVALARSLFPLLFLFLLLLLFLFVCLFVFFFLTWRQYVLIAPLVLHPVDYSSPAHSRKSVCSVVSAGPATGIYLRGSFIHAQVSRLTQLAASLSVKKK